MTEFKFVIDAVGERPAADADQNASRHYSERFSKEVALWIREKVIERKIGVNVLPPEGKVDTIYGVGHRGKSLDIGVLNERKYLVLNISIKTFNFKDRKTKNYRHNYTGRFYELLGEELDLRRSYVYSTLAAIIFLPEDSLVDTNPSSFAHAVRQFSKIAKKQRDEIELGFEFVFIAVHNTAGKLFLFDAAGMPPRFGAPSNGSVKSMDEVLDLLATTVKSRFEKTEVDELPVYTAFSFDDAVDE
jgi:hypothetical protein